MLADILLFWIGMQLNAPTWYWWVLGVRVFISVLTFGLNMYKKGAEK